MNENWTTLKLITWLTSYLEDKGVSKARLNAEHLIAHGLNLSRMDIYLQFERLLSPDDLAKLKPLAKRRANREPLQHILGTQPFRNVEIKVNSNVLIPRPETEILVGELLKTIPMDSTATILELGVGSGAISAAIADERASVTITGVEICPKALETAKENIEPYKNRVNLLLGNLFGPVKDKKFDIIVSNPPYATEVEWLTLEPEVNKFEPRGAVVAGQDGLDFYRKILNSAPSHLNDAGMIFFEFGDGQAKAIVSIAEKCPGLSEIVVSKDLNNKDRIFTAKYSEGTNG